MVTTVEQARGKSGTVTAVATGSLKLEDKWIDAQQGQRTPHRRLKGETCVNKRGRDKNKQEYAGQLVSQALTALSGTRVRLTSYLQRVDCTPLPVITSFQQLFTLSGRAFSAVLFISFDVCSIYLPTTL